MISISKVSQKILSLVFLSLFMCGASGFAQNSQGLKDGETLVEQAKANSAKTAVSYVRDYSSKFRITTQNTKGKKSSKAYEYFCTQYGCRNILIEENGNPLSEKKIEKNRENASKQLSAISESPTNFKTENAAANALGSGLKFFAGNVLLQPNLILNNCDLKFIENLKIENRDTAKFNFNNCRIGSDTSSNFKKFLTYMPEATGFIWIDKIDQAVVKAETFQKNVAASENTESLIAMNFGRNSEGLWFWKLIKVNALKNPKLFPDMEENWQVEFFDYKLYRIDADYKESPVTSETQNVVSKDKEKIINLNAKDKPLDWAKAALTAHGGESLVRMKSLTLLGSIEATPPNFPQTLPGSFALVQSGDKGRLQIDLGVFKFIQVYDGKTLDSTLKQVVLPPLTKYGISVLAKIESSGYSVAESASKAPFTFSLTSPEGVITEFVLDSKTGRVKSCNSSFVLDDTKMNTSIEYDTFEEIKGVLVPKKFYQRLDFGQDSAYIKYNVKTVNINTEVNDDVFILKDENR